MAGDVHEGAKREISDHAEEFVRQLAVAVMPKSRTPAASSPDEENEVGIEERPSKSEDSLEHRDPAGHSRGIRSKGSAIRSVVNPHQLRIDP